MKIIPMEGRTGKPVANQYVLQGNGWSMFQSYDTIIATNYDNKITLDHNWNYSRTTAKYLREYLGHCKATTEARIAGGVYVLKNLNEGG